MKHERQQALEPERLHLEFTESAFIEASEELMKNLEELSAIGISFALDDFGTGFSSFGHLSRFPLDAVRLDQMFVRNLTTDRASQAIVQSIKTLADGSASRSYAKAWKPTSNAPFSNLSAATKARAICSGERNPQQM